MAMARFSAYLWLMLILGVSCGGDDSPAQPSTQTESSVLPTPEPTSLPVVQPSPTPDSPDANIWHPPVETTWQWQLIGQPMDTTFDVDMYDIDLFDNEAEVVAALQGQGRKVICYVNAGGWEDWRPDADLFPQNVIGKNLDDWDGERWLDIRRLDALGPILEARFDDCQQKGFDGIEPDNVDGFLNDTGFPLTYDDQLKFNIWLADQAHQRGLSIGLKNDMDQIADLLSHFDWALNEECFQFDECETLLPFIEAGKPVFNVEYALEISEFCDRARAMRFMSLKKNLDVDAAREAC
ncbi:MAG: endo alpha-1,4 polygalactosaminidase [SAR202 cluster bacterium]|nr:endo alpha-1,4 polygalactosaminidase [SAR202 cluster bacterium]